MMSRVDVYGPTFFHNKKKWKTKISIDALCELLMKYSISIF